MGITSNYAQEFIIRADEVFVPEGCELYLHDKLMDTYTPLLSGTEYRFAITKDTATQGNARFEISMKPLVALTNACSFNLLPNPAANDVKVSYTIGSNATITLTNVNGMTLYTKQLVGHSGAIAVPLYNLPAGINLVTLEADGQKTVKRLVKE